MTIRIAGSLERRLWLNLVLVYAAALVVSIGSYLAVQWQSFDRDFDEANEALVGEIAAAAVAGKPVRDTLRKGAGVIYGVQAADGALLAGDQRALLEAPPAQMGQGARSFRHFIDQDGRRRYAVSVVIPSPRGLVSATLVRDPPRWADILDWATQELTSEVLPIFLPLLLAAAISAIVVVRAGLRPLRGISEEAEALSRAEVGARLDTQEIPVEVVGLARAINTALDRLALAYRRHRQFAADAAHELRTPLAVLRLRIESAGAGSPALFADFDRMSRMIDQLLHLATLDAGDFGKMNEIDLTAVAREAVAEVAPLAIAAGKDLSLAAPNRDPVLIQGDAEAIGHAVRNLLENALRHSAVGGLVEIEVDADGQLSVSDRGPGVRDEHKARVFDRFWRGADRKSPGAGLGLAIVSDTAVAHGGMVEVVDRAGGGAVFVMRFPLSGSVQLGGR